MHVSFAKFHSKSSFGTQKELALELDGYTIRKAIKKDCIAMHQLSQAITVKLKSPPF